MAWPLDMMIGFSYGKTPTEEEMKASGGFCPICQDEFQEPTMLHCKHIFCENCVATWFDRDTPVPCVEPSCRRTPAGGTEPLVSSFSCSERTS